MSVALLVDVATFLIVFIVSRSWSQNKLNQLEQKDGFGVFKKTLRIFKSIFLMVFVSHLLGCFFTMLIDPNSEENWLYAYDPKMMDAPVWERYTVSLYWAIITISTMGYGDVLPVTSTERIFSVAVALIGAVVFSYSMGNITSLISQTAGADVKFDEKLRFVEASIHLFHLCDSQILARWPLACKIGLTITLLFALPPSESVRSLVTVIDCRD